MSDGSILLVGATGYFGRLLLAELMQWTNARILAAARNQKSLATLIESMGSVERTRLSAHTLDLQHPASFKSLVERSEVVICAAGPFQALPLTLVSCCLDSGVDYIDLADDREFVRAVHRLAESQTGKAHPAICTGWSAVSALSGALARIASKDLDDIESIDIHIAPGNRLPRAPATVASLLKSVGRPFEIWRDGAWHKVSGWSAPRRFEFPSPVGPRTGYLVDVPDHDLFPRLFAARSVAFRVGSELHILNWMTSGLAALVRLSLIRDLSRWTRMIRRGMTLFARFGHDHGAVGVEVTGSRDGRAVTRRVCVVADRMGQRIPVMPAAIMACMLLNNEVNFSGIVPVDSWLTRDRLEQECLKRGYRLICEEL